MKCILEAVTLAALAVVAGACSSDNGTMTTSTWRQLAPMTTPRSGVAAAALDGKVYVAGGLLENGSATADVEAYDPATDTWEAIAPMPATRHHAAAVSLGGKLYVIGGFQATSNDAVNSVFGYDPAAKGWWELSPMPTMRGGLAAAEVNGLIYAMGGSSVAPDGSLVSVKTAEVFDPAINYWAELLEMLAPRDQLAVAAVDGHVYAIGGRSDLDDGSSLDRNEEYDPRALSWTAFREPLPIASSGIAAAELSGRIYVFGGEGTEGTYDQNEAYDPDSDSWETLSPMPTARHDLGAAVVGDTIYVVGGSRSAGTAHPSGANEAFTP
jgi:N-acetylneuraminic acid mutarotase